MAKKKQRRKGHNGINKSQEIRDVFDAKGSDFRPKDLIALLATKGIDVSPAQVSNVKAAMFKGLGMPRRGRGRPPSVAVSVAALQQAKMLVDQVGSVAAAKQALDLLDSLR